MFYFKLRIIEHIKKKRYKKRIEFKINIHKEFKLFPRSSEQHKPLTPNDFSS